MLLVSLAPTLDAALAFFAGGATGIVLTRVAKLPPPVATLAIVDEEWDGAREPAQSLDDAPLLSSAPVLESAALVPRARTGRLRLPERVTALTPSDEPALTRVNEFADRLAALPVEEWLDIGRSEIAAPARASLRSTAFALLEAAIAANGLGIAAWYARDTVETSVCLATGGTSCRMARDRRVMAAAHGAAEAAALALLARDVLAPTDFAVLLAPFEHVLSRDEGTRLTPSRHS